jgi:hypothetical protein
MSNVVFAICGNSAGRGTTPEEAHKDLCKSAEYFIPYEQIKFYEATRLKVVVQYVINKDS